MPLSQAICWVIYTFCKIRGEKVVVRFLNVETRYLELLLLAIEEAERRGEAAVREAASEQQQPEQQSPVLWTWHERYVVLLNDRNFRAQASVWGFQCRLQLWCS